MRKSAENYYNNLFNLVSSIYVTDRTGNIVGFYEGIEIAGNRIVEHTRSGNQVIFIGNGGSAAVASHMSADFCKNGQMKAVSFNDSSLLTCLSNDFGYQYVFEKPIEIFAAEGDILVAISSSGNSENIIKGVEKAKEKGCHVITLSGFKRENRLFPSGDLNFHVPSHSYGIVEVAHHSVCHCILDSIMHKKEIEKDIKEKIYE